MKQDKTWLKFLLIGIILLIIPLAIGLPLSLVYQNSIYLEVIFIIFGLIELLVFFHRDRRRDSANYKKNKTIFEDKKTKEYKSFRINQFFLLGIGIISIILSVIVFYITK